MTNPNNVVINSAIAQTGATAGDYKTQIIIDTHFHSFARVTSYASGGYSSIPVGSALRLALDAAFSTDIKPPVVKVGRSKGTAVYAPAAVVVGSPHGFTITVDNNGVIASHTASYTAQSGDTLEDICDGLKTAFDLVTAITDVVTLTVSAPGGLGILAISLDSSADDFKIDNFTGNYTLSGATVETPAETLAAIQDHDDDWSWVTSTNHLPAYQTAMGNAVEALRYKKFCTSTQLDNAYSNWNGVTTPDSNDVGAVFKFNNLKRSNVFYHHLANTLYPEMRRISYFAQLEPGRSNFQYKTLPGVSLAMINGGSRKLNTQELLNIKARNMTTVVYDGGQSYVGGYDGSGNRMANGVRIESVYWTDRAAQVLKSRALTLLLNKNKMGMNDNDIAMVIGSFYTWLNTQVSTIGSTYALDPVRPFKITYPKASEISFDDKVAGLLQGITITAYSDASIDKIIADLTVTFYDPSLEG